MSAAGSIGGARGPLGRLTLVGGGGHAVVVAEAAHAMGFTLAGFYDDDPKAPVIDLAPCLGGFEKLDEDDAIDGAAIVAVGGLELRNDLIARVRGGFATVVHPSAIVSPSATLGVGVFVGPLAVVHARARVGDHAIINTAAVVEHDCLIGRNAHIAPTAALGGEARVGPDTLVGLGAKLLPGSRVGARSTVGAGSVVVSTVGDDVVAVGVPARARH